MTLFLDIDNKPDVRPDEFHPFWPTAGGDWGYRPYCRTCGREARNDVHKRVK
jgi:hypothetical protein